MNKGMILHAVPVVLSWLVLLAVALWSGSAIVWFFVTFLLFLVAISALTGMIGRKNLRFTLQVPSVASVGTVQHCILRVQDTGRLPLGRVCCLVRVQNLLTGDDCTAKVFLQPGRKQTAFATMELRPELCGYLRLQLCHVFVSDVIGCVSLPVQAQCTARMTVLPELADVHLLLSYPAGVPDDGENWLDGRMGTDYTQTLQLREYMPGDSLKQVHWKLSSKLEKLIVRDPSYPVSRSLLVVWDKTAAEATAEQMDAMARAVFAVSHAISVEGYAYTLCWNDGIRIHTQLVESEEQLLQSMPHLLKSGCHDAPDPALAYLPQNEWQAYSRILYFSAGVPAQDLLDTLTVDSAATLFLCMEKDPQLPYPTIVYTPETCLQALQTLELLT